MSIATLKNLVASFLRRNVWFFSTPCFILVYKRSNEEMINKLTMKERRSYNHTLF